jgi:hypothetical protein
MPEVLEAPVAEAKPLTPSEDYAAIRAARIAAATPEAIAKAAADKAAAAGVVPPVEKRASGDERKFSRQMRRRDQEIGALRAQVEALTPKPAAAAASPAAGAAPKAEDFATPEEFRRAEIQFETKKLLDKEKAETAQSKEVSDTLAAYNDRMAKAPDKYDDWAATLEAGKGAALSVDLGKECPSLMWAIASSPYADDCFYHWLKDSSKLQGLIDLYKAGPQGEIKALTAFHRFEGQVGKDAPAKKAEVKEPVKKADDAVKVPKPRPSAEATVRAGVAAPDGKPEIYLPGTHVINPAWKVWRRNQQ